MKRGGAPAAVTVPEASWRAGASPPSMQMWGHQHWATGTATSMETTR